MAEIFVKLLAQTNICGEQPLFWGKRNELLNFKG